VCVAGSLICVAGSLMLACRRCTSLVTTVLNFVLEHAVTEILGNHYEVELNEKGQRLADVYTLINYRLL
jgi:hypothetical protein